ncbi:hypothetical protein MY10362_007549 [Beauveria mimosiformis]
MDGIAQEIHDRKPVIFLSVITSRYSTKARLTHIHSDIDNCLYSRNTNVGELVRKLITSYIAERLDVPTVEAVRIRQKYYSKYGLAIGGLMEHHQVDPRDYNSSVDDALPLDGILKPRRETRRLLDDINKSKVKLWLFTNSYITHAMRVVKLLGLEDIFDGVTYCDYAERPLVCKPHPAMYQKAMREAGVDRTEDCFFVDDSYSNCVAAKDIGWTVAHLVEEGHPIPETPAAQYQIRDLQALRNICPQFFRLASVMKENKSNL